MAYGMLRMERYSQTEMKLLPVLGTVIRTWYRINRTMIPVHVPIPNTLPVDPRALSVILIDCWPIRTGTVKEKIRRNPHKIILNNIIFIDNVMYGKYIEYKRLILLMYFKEIKLTIFETDKKKRFFKSEALHGS